MKALPAMVVDGNPMGEVAPELAWPSWDDKTPAILYTKDAVKAEDLVTPEASWWDQVKRTARELAGRTHDDAVRLDAEIFKDYDTRPGALMPPRYFELAKSPEPDWIILAAHFGQVRVLTSRRMPPGEVRILSPTGDLMARIVGLEVQPAGGVATDIVMQRDAARLGAKALREDYDRACEAIRLLEARVEAMTLPAGAIVIRPQDEAAAVETMAKVLFEDPQDNVEWRRAGRLTKAAYRATAQRTLAALRDSAGGAQ